MAKEAKEAVSVAPVGPSGPWSSAARGDTWVDSRGREHVVIGVVHEGFDSRCDGADECWRLWSHATRTEKRDGNDVVVHFRKSLSDEIVAEVSAWKKRS